MADPIVPNMWKDIVSYLRIITNEVAIVCLQLSVDIKRARGANQYLEMTIPVRSHHQKIEVKLQEDDPNFEYNSWRRSLTVFPLARRETASSAKDTWMSSVVFALSLNLNNHHHCHNTILVPEVRTKHEANCLLITKWHFETFFNQVQSSVPDKLETLRT